MPEQVLVDTSEHVRTITLNQPARFNALSQQMLAELDTVVRQADRDPDVRVMVLTGAGKAFSSGADITEFAPAHGMDAGDHLRRTLNPLVMRFRTTEKPVICAVNGVAAGAGVSLALACDLRCAAKSARFVLAFVKIGLIPDAGLLYFLPRLVGPAKTLELSWTGDPIDADEALALGMVNRVVSDDAVVSASLDMARRLATGPATTLGLIKRAVSQAHELPLDRVLELEAMYQTVASGHPNFAEGVAAFKAKRAPAFG